MSPTTSNILPIIDIEIIESPALSEASADLDNVTATKFLSHIFTVEYRADGAIHHRNFFYDGAVGLPGAIERAKSYCARMRYRFIFCSAFLTNLEEQEKRMERFG